MTCVVIAPWAKHDAIRTGLSLALALGETLGCQLSGTSSATSW
jgi:hypothetical protein